MMLRMRRLEEQVLRFAEAGLMRGHFHVYIGQEAAGAGACAPLHAADQVFTTHRNHAHVLAKGGDPMRVLAEIIGRVDGYCGGRAGTFHVAAPELGIPHTSAIVGGCLPLAAGTAYAAQTLGTGQATVVFFGDGALEEGVAYETFNIAQLWRLPVLFFMENNAVSPEERAGRGSPTSTHAASALADLPRAFNIETHVVDGTDVEAVSSLVSGLVARLREGQGPMFVESRTSRWPGSYGNLPRLVGGETEIAWSWAPDGAPEPVRDWSRRSDPVLLHARRLLTGEALSQAQLIELDAEVRAELADAAQRALASPPPKPETALEWAYA